MFKENHVAHEKMKKHLLASLHIALYVLLFVGDNYVI